MDKYLLGSDLSDYLDCYDHLNSFEQCLLIGQLKDKERARSLARYMMLQISEKKDQEAVNYGDKIFDLVLNLNSLNQNKDALGDLKQKKEQERREMEMTKMSMRDSDMSYHN